MALRSVALSKQARGGSRQQNRFWRTSDEVRPVLLCAGGVAPSERARPKMTGVRRRRARECDLNEK